MTISKKARLTLNIIALMIFQGYLWIGVYPMYSYYPEYKKIIYALLIISLTFTLAILISIYLILSEEDKEKIRKFLNLKDLT